MESPTTLSRITGARRAMADERGFTLPEMLISLLLTLVMTGAALQALISSNRSASGAAWLTDVNQTMRVAMNIIIRDLLQTGQDIPVGGIPFPSGGATLDVVQPGPDANGIEMPEDWVTLPAIMPAPAAGPVINGVATDIVTMLRKDPTIDFQGLWVDEIAPDGSFVTVNAAVPIDEGASAVKEGDLIMLSGGGKNAIQEVTSTDGQRIYFGTQAPSLLNQRSAPAGSVMALMNPAPPINSWPPVSLQRVMLVTYYIKTTTAGPQLIRKVNFGAERVIAVGVENLQLTWDLVDGVTNPANLEQPESPNTPHEIRKANLHMGARSVDTTTTGTFLRSTLSTQVSLRSLAFVDRYK